MGLLSGVLKVHEKIYKSTDGRLGHELLGVPTLLLRTTGRRTGQTRTNALLYGTDGGRYLVVASRGGSDQAPAWLHNLRAQPQVEIQIGRERRAATATILGSGDHDFQRLWELLDRINRGRYTAYQKQTKRPIPIVALTPDG